MGVSRGSDGKLEGLKVSTVKDKSTNRKESKDKTGEMGENY